MRSRAAGRAWRGYFPVGEELTSGVPDLKEGLYFGQDLDTSNPRVTAAWLLHGANLFPKYVREHLHGGSSSVQATPLDVSTSSRHWELMR